MPAGDAVAALNTILGFKTSNDANKLRAKELELQQRQYDKSLEMMDKFGAQGGGLGPMYNLTAPNGAAVDSQGFELQTPGAVPQQPGSTPAISATPQQPKPAQPLGTQPAVVEDPDDVDDTPDRSGLLDQTDPSVAPARAKGWSVNSLIPYAKPTASLTISTNGGVSFNAKNPDVNELRAAGISYMGWAARNGVPLEIARHNAKLGGLSLSEDDMNAIVGPDYLNAVNAKTQQYMASGADRGTAMRKAVQDVTQTFGWYPTTDSNYGDAFWSDRKISDELRSQHLKAKQTVDDEDYIRRAEEARAEAAAKGGVEGKTLGEITTEPDRNRMLGTELGVRRGEEEIGPAVGQATRMPPGTLKKDMPAPPPLAPIPGKGQIGGKDQILVPGQEVEGLNAIASALPQATYGKTMEAVTNILDTGKVFQRAFDMMQDIQTEAGSPRNAGIVMRALNGGFTIGADALSQETELGQKIAAYNTFRLANRSVLAKGFGKDVGNMTETEQDNAVAPLLPVTAGFILPEVGTVEKSRAGVFGSLKDRITTEVQASRPEGFAAETQAVREAGATEPAAQATPTTEGDDKARAYLSTLSPAATEKLLALDPDIVRAITSIARTGKPIPKELFDPAE